MRSILTHLSFCKFIPNSYDAAAEEEDEPAEAKFSDDEDEKAYLRDQKRGETGTNSSVGRPLILKRFSYFVARTSALFLVRRTHFLITN